MKKVRNYNFVKEIKSGKTEGIGKISLYLSDTDNKSVAIKEIDISDLTKQEIKSLQKEAEILEKVNHPNIIKFFESFIENENLYIVME